MTDCLSEDASKIADLLKGVLPGSTFLITGATGLIGTYLIETLLKIERPDQPVEAVHAVSLSGDVPSWLSRDARLHRQFGDISESTFIRELPMVDVVVHAAGYGQPGKFLAHPLQTVALNTTGTIELMSRVKSGGAFLFVSTSEIYSGLTNGPFKETQVGTTNTDHPRACYIEGKRAGEALVNSHRDDISAASVRLALAYGPGTQAGDARVLNEFIAQALTTGTIVMRDAGMSKRTYCYVSDAVQLMFAVLNSRQSGIFNVGGVSRTSVRRLADIVAAECGAVVYPGHGQSVESKFKGAPSAVELDLSKTLSLGVTPEWVNLRNGVSRTLQWQRHHIFQGAKGTR